jgi:hypothetical protein
MRVIVPASPGSTRGTPVHEGSLGGDLQGLLFFSAVL